MKRKPKAMRGISRIDSKDTHGWFVRHYRETKTVSKFFSDNVHGGKVRALCVAKDYRDEYERENPPDPWRNRFRTKIQRNNTTGVIGVCETTSKYRQRDTEKQPCFSVSWCPQPNKAKCRKFFFHAYGGREKALQAAVEFRKEREAEIKASAGAL